MSLGFLVEDDTPIVWRGPMLHKALTQFVHDVHWGELDVLLLDLRQEPATSRCRCWSCCQSPRWWS